MTKKRTTQKKVKNSVNTEGTATSAQATNNEPTPCPQSYSPTIREGIDWLKHWIGAGIRARQARLPRSANPLTGKPLTPFGRSCEESWEVGYISERDREDREAKEAARRRKYGPKSRS